MRRVEHLIIVVFIDCDQLFDAMRNCIVDVIFRQAANAGKFVPIAGEIGVSSGAKLLPSRRQSVFVVFFIVIFRPHEVVDVRRRRRR